MGTSLAEQLKKLAVPQTSLLLEDKKRASLLFDPKEAANLDRETVYEIGLKGLEELKKLEPRFSDFERTLFSYLSKGLERSVQSTEANKKLDKDIQRFIFLLSPYFLLKCAHQALEWLIRRFHIHQFNIDDVLMLILPYHETRMFVRVLQLLDVKDPINRWHWLRPLQKPGVPLSKLALLNHCASDNSFLHFVVRMTLLAVKVHGDNCSPLSTLFSFSCTTIIGAIEYCKSISEIQVTHILELLLKGIPHSAVDFSASSLMITGQLARKAQLSQEFLFRIIGKISKNFLQKLQTECVTLLVLLYQTQQDTLTSFPPDALSKLIKSNKFVSALQYVSSSGAPVMPLLLPLLSATLEGIQVQDEEESAKLKAFAEQLITEVSLNNKDAELFIRTAIDAFHVDNKDDSGVVDWYSSFLNHLERQYALVFDVVAVKSLKGAEPVKKAALRTILGFVPNIDQSQGSVFEKLRHVDPEVRAEAVEYFVKHHAALKGQNKELLAESLKERLRDDSPQVIDAVLKFSPADLASIVGEDFLIDELLNLTRRFWYIRSSHMSVTRSILTCLCSKLVTMSQRDRLASVLVAVLPYLLPVDSDDVEFFATILGSPFGEHNLFFTIFSEVPPTLTEWCTHLFKGMCSRSFLPSFPELFQLWSQAKEDLASKFILLLLLTTAASDLEEIWEVIHLTQECIKGSKLTLADGSIELSGEGISACMAVVKKKAYPLQAVVHTVTRLAKRIVLPQDLKIGYWLDLSIDKSPTLLLVKMFELLLQCNKKSKKKSKQFRKAHAKCIKNFFEIHFPELQRRITFLSNLWVLHEVPGVVDNKIQLLSLLLATNLLYRVDLPITWAVDFENKNLIPSLLIALCNPLRPVRQEALECLAIPSTALKGTNKKNSYIVLAQKLHEKKEELIMDPEQLSVVLYTLLSPNPEVQSLIKSDSRPSLKKTLDALLQCILDKDTPIYACSALLKALTFVNSQDILLELVPLGEAILAWGEEHNNQLDVFRSAILKNILTRLNRETAGVLQHKTYWSFFESALKNYHTQVYSESGKSTCPAVLAMETINKEVFESVPDQQQDILSLLVDLGTESDSPDVISAVGRVFRNIVLDCSLVLVELEKMKNAKDTGSQVSTTKIRKRTIYSPPSLELLKSGAWRRGITLLQLIQNKRKLQNMHLLLSVLSGILQRCLEFEQQAPVEYSKQLVLSCLLNCCQKLAADSSSYESETPYALNVELVIQCIRGTQNPQTHHHALLVLTQMAGISPERVLHNIMEIFIFMGSSVLRQDDGYSFQTISKVIETVIPIIVKAKDHGLDSSQMYNVAASVLRVFADALLNVPEYRRLALYSKLMNIMDARNFLWLLVCLVLEAQVRVGSKDQAKRIDLLVDITLKFSPDIILQNCIHVMEYLRTLPTDKDEDGEWQREMADNIKRMSETSSMPVVSELFDVKRYTAKQLRHFRYMATTFFCTLLSSHTLINQVAELSEEETSQLEDLYKSFIELILCHIQWTSKEAELNRENPSAKYWKVMLHHGYEILDKVTALLPSTMFLLVVQGLLDNKILTVQRKIMELLNSQLLQKENAFANCKQEDLFALVPALMKIVLDLTDTSSEHQLNQQTALISIKLLARLLAAENTDKFKEVLKVLTKLASSKAVEGNILASLVLCLGELCSALRAAAISHLPKVMPVLLRILKPTCVNDSQDMLLLASVSAIYKIVEVLPYFLSPYLEPLLLKVCVLSSLVQQEPDSQKLAPVQQKLKAIRQKVSGMIPPRVLIPTVSKCHSELLSQREFAALGPLMEILADSFSTMSNPEINQFLPDLTTFFLSALQFRCDSGSTDEGVMTAEGHIIQALVTLVLKLSESSFRPLYYSLFHWATSIESHKDRIITFYRLSSSLAEGLKGLFVLFAGHFVKHAATMLDENNVTKAETVYFTSEAKSLLTVEYVLKTLHSVFLYDSQQFLTKERFETLMQPLVDQLENTLGGTEALEARATSLLTPCIGQFAVAVADDLLWKQLNYQILLKTRHNSSQVRLIALATVCEVARKLGQDFLPLLPETIPFLAELMEDEDEAVEKVCQKTVQEMEEVLDEPLQKYF